MSNVVLLDNDIALKTCCYDLVGEVCTLLAGDQFALAVLGVAKFVLRKRIEKSGKIEDRQRASTALGELLSKATKLEPNIAEVELAASFEVHAQMVGVAFDPGESLLLAALIRRSALALVTGDKRAIVAVDQIATALDLHTSVDGRLLCLEQVVLALCETMCAAKIATRICAEALVDMAMSICFSCSTGCFEEARTLDGLQSYIADLRKQSGAILTASRSLIAGRAETPRRAQ